MHSELHNAKVTEANFAYIGGVMIDTCLRARAASLALARLLTNASDRRCAGLFVDLASGDQGHSGKEPMLSLSKHRHVPIHP